MSTLRLSDLPPTLPPEPTAARQIWLCADDYGISPAVNTAIRDLIARGRLNATSVMVAAPSFKRSDAVALLMLNSGIKRVSIGLHVTMTAPFRPLSRGFAPLEQDMFLSHTEMLKHGTRRMLDRDKIAAEIAAQIQTFQQRFGRMPDFIDGHQHVHLFPRVRDAFLTTVKELAPDAWVRQCGRVGPLHQRLADRKGFVLDILSRRFRKQADKAGLRTNTAFAGTYAFRPKADITNLFPRFLDALPDGALVMCHPGFVDDELTRLDPLTTLREREHAYFSGPEFPAHLSRQGLALASPHTRDR